MHNAMLASESAVVRRAKVKRAHSSGQLHAIPVDHSGALPVLWKRGYRGPIYATPATRDLCAPMLEDAARIQASDAAYIDRLIELGVDLQPVTPLYDSDDVVGTLELMIGVPYHRKEQVAHGVSVTFLDAGHVLGSAIVVLDIEDEGRHVRLAFTGDLGHVRLPILRDPEVPTGVECPIRLWGRCRGRLEQLVTRRRPRRRRRQRPGQRQRPRQRLDHK